MTQLLEWDLTLGLVQKILNELEGQTCIDQEVHMTLIRKKVSSKKSLPRKQIRRIKRRNERRRRRSRHQALMKKVIQMLLRQTVKSMKINQRNSERSLEVLGNHQRKETRKQQFQLLQHLYLSKHLLNSKSPNKNHFQKCLILFLNLQRQFQLPNQILDSLIHRTLNLINSKTNSQQL